MRGLDDEGLVDEVQSRAGLPDRRAASRTLAGVLEVLGEVLAASEAETVAEALPHRCGSILRGSRPRGARGVNELYEHVAQETGTPFGLARESARVACQVIARALDGERGAFLRERLPAEWSSLFAAPEQSPIAEGAVSGRGRTLATGRPGSTHPLSEAHPPSGQAESVVMSDNPHADEKVSSAPGPRFGHEIATSRDGSEVPLSEAHDPVRRR
jgi:uncharacterized protein (DUF2267 family)